MKLSTKGRYGTRAALELAIRHGSGPVFVREIAESQDISERYLEQILNTLRASGIVKSTRGAKGGYELSRDPSKISLGEIVRSLEGQIDIVSCTSEEKCQRSSECVMYEVWSQVKNSINDILDHTSLADIASRHNVLKLRGSNNYTI